MTPQEQLLHDRWFDGFITEGEAVRALTRTGLSEADARKLLHGDKAVTQAEHPLVTGARKRLDSLSARTPPGLPLHYVLQHHDFACTGCGSRNSASILLACERTGGGAKGYHAVRQERIYDLPVVETRTSFVTPRCDKCFDALPRAAVPVLPPAQKRLALRASASTEIDLAELGLL